MFGRDFSQRDRRYQSFFVSFLFFSFPFFLFLTPASLPCIRIVMAKETTWAFVIFAGVPESIIERTSHGGLHCSAVLLPWIFLFLLFFQDLMALVPLADVVVLTAHRGILQLYSLAKVVIKTASCNCCATFLASLNRISYCCCATQILIFSVFH